MKRGGFFLARRSTMTASSLTLTKSTNTVISYNSRGYAGGNHGDLAPSKPITPISHADTWPNGYRYNLTPGFERPKESWENLSFWRHAFRFGLVYVCFRYIYPTSPDDDLVVETEIERRKKAREEGTGWDESMLLDDIAPDFKVPALYREDGVYQYNARYRYLHRELEEMMNEPYKKDRKNL